MPRTAPPSQEPEGRRTSPLSLAARGLQAIQQAIFPVIAFIFFTRDENLGMPIILGVMALIVLASLGMAYLAWTRFTYTVGVDDIRVESGILSRAARSVPYERIQDVSLEQALIPRLLGLVEVRFETGAGGGEDLKLAYLAEGEGDRLRELVRARRDGAAISSGTGGDPGSDDSAVSPAQEPAHTVFAMNPDRLVVFGLFEFSLAIVAVIGGLAQQFEFLLPFELWDFDGWEERLAGPGAQMAGLGPLAQVIAAAVGLGTLIVLGITTGLVQVFLRDWNFLLERTAKGFRRRRGLLTKTDVVMPAHRVQALRIGTRLLRRLFGWHDLKFISLAQDAGSASHVVAPFAKLEEIAPIVAEAGFDMPSDDLDWQRSSRKYRFDSMAIAAVFILPLSIIPIALDRPLFALIPVAVTAVSVMAELIKWHFARNAIDIRQLYRRTGWLAPGTTIAHRVKLHSAEIKQGPIARRRGYATLHLGLAGGALAVEGIPLERAKTLRAAILESIAGTDFSQLNQPDHS